MIKNISIAFIITFLGTIHSFAQERYNSLMYEGNRYFNQKNYEHSSSKFIEAAKQNSKDFAAHYNLANALYKQKKYDEAKAEYNKALSLAKNNDDKSASLYNNGNALMQSQQFEKAAEFYKKALKIDPYNEEIRKNYGIAKMKIKSKNNQKQDKQKDNKDQSQEKEKNQKGESKDDKNSQQQGKQEDGTQGNQNQGKGEGQNQKPRNNNDRSKMPKSQYDAIMNKIEGKEQETARKILNKNSFSVPQSNEKDW